MANKKISYLLAVLIIFCSNVNIANAQKSKKKSNKTKVNFKMLESFSQRTMPGRPEQQPTTNYYFILVWNSTVAPATFFWRGDNGWMSCNMAYVHRTGNKKSSHFMPDNDYTTESITGHEVKKGDTLEIIPVRGGKFPIPKEVDQNATNTLYYKTTKSNWIAYPVKQIKAKQDLVMP
jgi:hypothetical protein